MIELNASNYLESIFPIDALCAKVASRLYLVMVKSNVVVYLLMMVCLQTKLNDKRIFGAAIAFIWLFTLAFETTVATLSTDIIKTTCIPWGAYSSYAAMKSITSLLLLIAYLLPLMIMVYCYSKVVIKLRTKVLFIR